MSFHIGVPCALRRAELELIDRARRMVERRIKEARFPTVKGLDSFDFTTSRRSLSLKLRHWSLEFAGCEYVNVIAAAIAAPGRRTLPSDGAGWAGCLLEGLVGRLRHGRCRGPQDDRGPGREATGSATAPTGSLQAADHR